MQPSPKGLGVPAGTIDRGIGFSQDQLNREFGKHIIIADIVKKLDKKGEAVVEISASAEAPQLLHEIKQAVSTRGRGERVGSEEIEKDVYRLEKVQIY